MAPSERTLSVDPLLAEASMTLGRLYMSTGRPTRDRSTYASIGASRLWFSFARGQIGHAYLQQGMRDEALADSSGRRVRHPRDSAQLAYLTQSPVGGSRRRRFCVSYCGRYRSLRTAVSCCHGVRRPRRRRRSVQLAGARLRGTRSLVRRWAYRRASIRAASFRPTLFTARTAGRACA